MEVGNADGPDGVVQSHDSLGTDILVLDSSSLDPSRDIVEVDAAHIATCLDGMHHGRVVVGLVLGVHT